MPMLASTVCAEVYAGAVGVAGNRVPENLIESPTSKGACWLGSGSVADRAARVFMTNSLQYAAPAAGGVSSPLTGGAIPATLKFRQPPATADALAPLTVTGTRLGRFAWGHSGSSATAGSVRGTHIG